VNPQSPSSPTHHPASAPTPQPSSPSLLERLLGHWFISWLLIPAALIFFLHYFVFSAFHVIGSSMIPTLHDTDYLIIGKVDKTLSGLKGKEYIPARNQVIVFHYPKQPELNFVKRVVGLPGERVVIKNGQVRVYNDNNKDGLNPDIGHEIAGTYTDAMPDGSPIDVTVPPGNVFVLGDNRTPGGSNDSREWGMLPSDDIVGNVALRLYPFNKLKLF
jgi:signal peptidase I